MRMILPALLAASIAMPALAQDAPTHGFTGPRAELVAGHDMIDDGTGNTGDQRSGVIYGGAIGYDFAVAGSIIGIEAEVTGSTTDSQGTSLFVPGDALRARAGRDIYAGLRFGYVVSPGVMLYSKAGYSNARIDAVYEVGIQNFEQDENLSGVRAGAGAEVRLGGGLYAKAEYRYSHYGDSRYYDIDVDRHQLVGGIGIRF